MTDEDYTAAKLKGYNCLLVFRDNTELFLKVNQLELNDEDDVSDFCVEMEKFINNDKVIECCPIPGLALARDVVKYVKVL